MNGNNGNKKSILMRRRVFDIAALVVIVAGSVALAPLPPPATVSVLADKCKAGNGAECTGAVCCADSDECYTTKEACDRLFCANNPQSPVCVE
jgi:hypothetical protein